MVVKRSSRQSFLGPEPDDLFARCRVGIVGVGGGGSHIAQQLAHVGFQRFVSFDPDHVEDHNLNRLVGATEEDAACGRLKVEVVERVILGLVPDAQVEKHPQRWQEAPETLEACDLIFGCVDGFREREELQVCARRYLIPYIDIGLTVKSVGDEPPQMSGQVILVTPDGPCLRCLQFITEARLAEEAAEYGDAGIRPQVVWANGVLASTAVGLAVDLLTNWTRRPRRYAYLAYDGNLGTVGVHPKVPHLNLPCECPHFPPNAVGTVRFMAL